MPHIRKSGASSVILSNYLDCVLYHLHAKKYSELTYRSTIIFDRDNAEIKRCKSFLSFCFLFKELTWFRNIIELAKCKIKSRDSNYQSVIRHKFYKNTSLYINFNNGTAVVIGADHVYKFFFKDVDYFDFLYSCFRDNLQISTERQHKYFVVKMSRLNPCNIDIFSRDIEVLLCMASKKMLSLSGCIPSTDSAKELLSPAYKIEQIFIFYNVNDGTIKNRYISIGNYLLKSSLSCQNTLCHGDLWAENIMLSESQEYQLIDFDKCLIFCEYYDLVYFYIVSHESMFVQKISSNSMYLKNLIDKIIQYIFEIEEKIVIRFNVVLCVQLMALLKLTEYDLRSKRIGFSLPFLEDLIVKC
jgi:hypothetical protein